MGSRRGWRAVAFAAGLVGCGIAGDAAWRNGLWGSLAGSVLAAIWLAVLTWWLAVQPRPSPPREDENVAETGADRLVLDAAPTAMVLIDSGHARALNRAARRLFGADDRIVPAPAALIEVGSSHLQYEGRTWRLDRVTLGRPDGGRAVVALIDVEQEERFAEARAMSEMIHVLGHELLNGLAPIVSLAESGEAALDQPAPDPVLLREIVGTLARRAEGLQRFTHSYRELARLPLPRRGLVAIPDMVDDLARLFAGRWPRTKLIVAVEHGAEWPLDRDQVHQALWALLQNAAEAAMADRDGEPQVTLAADASQAALTIDVQDNGAGVALDDAARIFRPFYTTSSQGTGIGLSLARQIALAHGGSLALLSGAPTTFRLIIPRLDIERPTGWVESGPLPS